MGEGKIIFAAMIITAMMYIVGSGILEIIKYADHFLNLLK